MNRKTFNQGFAALLNGFAYAQERTSPETEEIYWHVLNAILDKDFNDGVNKCLMECKYFPAISDLVERIYPPYEKLPEYNPWGNPFARAITVTSGQQLAAVNRRAIGPGTLETMAPCSIEDKRGIGPGKTK